MITLFLRYTIDPNKLADIERYAADEQQPIRESGGRILGYFMPTDFFGADQRGDRADRFFVAGGV